MAWIADVVPEIPISSTTWGNLIRDRVVQVFSSEAARDATAVPRPGMLSWAEAEERLAIWRSSVAGWVILWEPWIAWTPEVWSGPTWTFTVTANRDSQWRHAGYVAEVFVSIDFTIGTTVPEDLIYILPPVATTRPGPFGTGWVRDPVNGTIGPLAVCDATHLTVQQLGLPGGLLARGDLSDADGTAEWYMEGRYVIG